MTNKINKPTCNKCKVEAEIVGKNQKGKLIFKCPTCGDPLCPDCGSKLNFKTVRGRRVPFCPPCGAFFDIEVEFLKSYFQGVLRAICDSLHRVDDKGTVEPKGTSCLVEAIRKCNDSKEFSNLEKELKEYFEKTNQPTIQVKMAIHDLIKDEEDVLGGDIGLLIWYKDRKKEKDEEKAIIIQVKRATMIRSDNDSFFIYKELGKDKDGKIKGIKQYNKMKSIAPNGNYFLCINQYTGEAFFVEGEKMGKHLKRNEGYFRRKQKKPEESPLLENELRALDTDFVNGVTKIISCEANRGSKFTLMGKKKEKGVASGFIDELTKYFKDLRFFHYLWIILITKG